MWVKGKAGKWPGGRIWREADGRYNYVIRRQRGGIRVEHYTGASGIRAALAQLERFEADPGGYTPGGDTVDRLVITPELVKGFLDFSRDEKGNSRGWLLQQRAYLAWWAEALAGKDLRRLDLGRDVIPALDGAPERRHRTEVLKAFCSWLRKERHLLSRKDDATLDLAVRARRPEQWTKPKAIPRPTYLRVLAALENPRHRDAFVLLDETGWHVSELVRFVRGGTVEPAPPGRTEAAILETRHKNGEPHLTAVGPDAKAAAERLRARSGFSAPRFYEAIKAACDKLIAERAIPEAVTPGRFRHTFATRAVDAGVAPEAVSAYLGHKSPATMRRFYATLAAPPKPTAPGSRPTRKRGAGRAGGKGRGGR